ncbi:prepilin-type N-terminal cleavage/methylation domain-containing protein [Maricaulis parjimensis]|uniref:prepilin-type N-terminal cleavage/methylation domain-containing protein n=1 Tax=Maricaulis parjimensis TaxID=144023 RepID=UPI001939A672|nr:prepilin-type N-terminal cleavage/methylation domain-containing protein [Maricaulis parjimensis]
MRRASDHEAGFTLLEVLMAGAILAAIAALMLPVIRIASQAETRVTERVDVRNTHAALEESMRELLAQAQTASADMHGQLLAGDSVQLSFLTRPRGHDGLYMAVLALQSDGVEISVSPYPDGTAFRTRFTLPNQDLRLHYFGDPADGLAPVWMDEWDREWMPRLVVLDMTRQDGQLRRIEALVGGQAPVDCEYDSGQGICLGADF